MRLIGNKKTNLEKQRPSNCATVQNISPSAVHNIIRPDSGKLWKDQDQFQKSLSVGTVAPES